MWGFGDLATWEFGEARIWELRNSEIQRLNDNKTKKIYMFSLVFDLYLSRLGRGFMTRNLQHRLFLFRHPQIPEQHFQYNNLLQTISISFRHGNEQRCRLFLKQSGTRLLRYQGVYIYIYFFYISKLPLNQNHVLKAFLFPMFTKLA